MYDNGDILLFALSAWRQTSWIQFKRCFDEIQRKNSASGHYDVTENATGHRWRALRDLSALGHIDIQINQDGIRVLAAPPVLATLPGFGNPTAVLCGGRSPRLIRELEAAAAATDLELTIDSQSTASPYAPARVEVRADDPAGIHSLAHVLGISYLDVPSARLLARVSITLAEYRQRLTWSNRPELNWRREDFDTDRLRFRPAGEASPQRRLSRYQDPTTSVWYYRLWQGNESADVIPDWGRYAILSSTSQRVLQYFPERRKAVVPYGAPLPTLLARAFGLCSGYCPTETQVTQTTPLGRCQEFHGVPPSVFNSVASKLEQATGRSR